MKTYLETSWAFSRVEGSHVECKQSMIVRNGEGLDFNVRKRKREYIKMVKCMG